MSYVFVCPKCKGVFKHPSTDTRYCPDCRVPLMYTDLTDSQWNALSVPEKNNIKEKGSAERLKAHNAQVAEEAARMAEMKKKRDAALPNILISSGFNFEGYRIVKYSGYISGDDACQIPRSGVFGGNNGQNLTNALVRIRRQALKELKEAAYDLGCNAVIGVDFDYITLEPETANISGGTLYEPYIICVTANGNAVVIEKV